MLPWLGHVTIQPSTHPSLLRKVLKERAVIAREGPTASATGVGVSREMLVCQEGETLQVIMTEHLRAQCVMRFLSPERILIFHVLLLCTLTPLPMPEDSRRLSPGPHLQTMGP